MRSHSRLPRGLSAVATVALLLLSACGSNDDSASTPTTGAPASERVLTIGVIAPLEAGLTAFGEGILDSVELAVTEANALEAIPGWTITVEAVDDSSDPDVGQEAITRLIDDPSVIGVVGPYNSGVAEAILPAMNEAGLALVSPGNTLASLTLGDGDEAVRPFDNYYRLVASDAYQAPFLAQEAYGLDLRNVAVVSETKAVSQNLAADFAGAFTDLGGTVPVQTLVPDANEDFSDFLTEAVTATPDAIFFGGEYDVAAALREQATAAGYTGPIIGGDGIKSDDFITRAGEAALGTWASSVGTPLDRLTSAEDFVNAYAAAGFDSAPTDFGVFAYDAANALIAAVAASVGEGPMIPTTARADVIAMLAQTSFQGASGPVSFDEFGDPVNRVFTLYQVRREEPGLRWAVVSTSTI
jgi:branched-chain amino acid transport system substrate-binding protein